MISIKLAKEISILNCKRKICDNRNDFYTLMEKIVELYPKSNLYFYCGFCIRHGYTGIEDLKKCSNCEIAKSDAKSCSDDDSLYSKINNAIQHDEYVDLINQFIEIIKNIPDNE